MGSIERASYSIRCRCGAVGFATWQESDGYQFATHGPQTTVKVSAGFDWVERVTDGHQSFFGRRLVCKACGRIPRTTEQRERTPALQASSNTRYRTRAGSKRSTRGGQ
jgi:ribosomal protein L37E